MSTIDEKRIDNLENRITKIEEYIKFCEKEKEDEWKSRAYKKLEAIEKRQMNLGFE